MTSPCVTKSVPGPPQSFGTASVRKPSFEPLVMISQSHGPKPPSIWSRASEMRGDLFAGKFARLHLPAALFFVQVEIHRAPSYAGRNRTDLDRPGSLRWFLMESVRRLFYGSRGCSNLSHLSLWRSSHDASRKTLSLLTIATIACAGCASSDEQRGTSGNPMTFFVTSAGSGKGADLGGISGADRHCQSLAQAAGAGGRTWRAYLSTSAADGAKEVNARDRIGRGPWRNAKGEVDREGRERPPRQQQSHEADGAHGERCGRQRARRCREHARHPDGFYAGWPCDAGRKRHDVRQLDEERRRLGDGRTSRSSGIERRRRRALVELIASVEGLQPGSPPRHGRRGSVLLLRCELISLLLWIPGPCACARPG